MNSDPNESGSNFFTGVTSALGRFFPRRANDSAGIVVDKQHTVDSPSYSIREIQTTSVDTGANSHAGVHDPVGGTQSPAPVGGTQPPAPLVPVPSSPPTAPVAGGQPPAAVPAAAPSAAPAPSAMPPTPPPEHWWQHIGKQTRSATGNLRKFAEAQGAKEAGAAFLGAALTGAMKEFVERFGQQANKLDPQTLQELVNQIHGDVASIQRICDNVATNLGTANGSRLRDLKLSSIRLEEVTEQLAAEPGWYERQMRSGAQFQSGITDTSASALQRAVQRMPDMPRHSQAECAAFAATMRTYAREAATDLKNIEQALANAQQVDHIQLRDIMLQIELRAQSLREQQDKMRGQLYARRSMWSRFFKPTTPQNSGA